MTKTFELVTVESALLQEAVSYQTATLDSLRRMNPGSAYLLFKMSLGYDVEEEWRNTTGYGEINTACNNQAEKEFVGFLEARPEIGRAFRDQGGRLFCIAQ